MACLWLFLAVVVHIDFILCFVWFVEVCVPGDDVIVDLRVSINIGVGGDLCGDPCGTVIEEYFIVTAPVTPPFSIPGDLSVMDLGTVLIVGVVGDLCGGTCVGVVEEYFTVTGIFATIGDEAIMDL